MANAAAGGYQSGLAKTFRTDRWWIEPTLTGTGFLIFVLYTTWAALQGEHYFWGSYLSPYYSPLLYIEPNVLGGAPLEHAWFGSWPSWWPSWWPEFLPRSPAIFILVGPLSFRMTCYYYRKFYYRSFFATPPGCAVNALPVKKYTGETKLLLIQNLHRYTLYIALAFIAILYYDAFISFFRDGKFGVGVGCIILLINPTLLAGYTFGCHAFRHLIGGKADCFSCPAGEEHMGHRLWSKASLLNHRHMLWAWMSMIWVGLTDLYIRMVSMGIIHDFNTWE